MTKDELRHEIQRLVDVGDQTALEEFLLSHLSEFSEEEQKELAFGFYTDAVDRLVGQKAIMDMQERGIETLDQIAAIKNILKQDQA